MLPTFAELFPDRDPGERPGFCLGAVAASARRARHGGILAASLPLGTDNGSLRPLRLRGVAFGAALLLPETAGTDLHEQGSGPTVRTVIRNEHRNTVRHRYATEWPRPAIRAGSCRLLLASGFEKPEV